MSLSIGPETTVGALLSTFPALEGVLVDMAPAFAKLRNPVVRRTVAKIATLEQVAAIGGVNLQAMILKLRLGGHLKTGHKRTLQNRPTEQNQNRLFIPCERALGQTLL